MTTNASNAVLPDTRTILVAVAPLRKKAGAVALTRRLHQKAVNFTEWGPACDGVTDDQAKFAQAAARRSRQPGKFLYVRMQHGTITASATNSPADDSDRPSTAHAQLLVIIDQRANPVQRHDR